MQRLYFYDHPICINPFGMVWQRSQVLSCVHYFQKVWLLFSHHALIWRRNGSLASNINDFVAKAQRIWNEFGFMRENWYTNVIKVSHVKELYYKSAMFSIAYTHHTLVGKLYWYYFINAVQSHKATFPSQVIVQNKPNILNMFCIQ